MKVIVDFCVVPLGVGVSLGQYIAACEKILARPGLKTQLHAYGTNIEGEWDEVFKAIKECHEMLHKMGVPRISASLRVGTRTDREQTMADKIRSVQAKMGNATDDANFRLFGCDEGRTTRDEGGIFHV